MSLTSSLHNALSGLNLAAKSAELISSNVANALTPGYARREVSVSTDLTASGGVKINGIHRHENLAVLGEARIASASVSTAQIKAEFYEKTGMMFGEIGSDNSLSQDMADFSAALTSATGNPMDQTRLGQVVNAAQKIAARVQSIASAIQSEREAADGNIDITVKALNSDLQRLEKLSQQMLRADVGSDHRATLLDQRNQILDSVAKAVPIKVFERPNGTFAVYSTSGASLMDINAAEIGFAPSVVITPNSTNLGTLTVNGNPIENLRGYTGGRLEALFNVRDTIAPTVQAELDQFTHDFAQSTTASDPKQIGLFTDRGNPLDSSLTNGFSSRIRLASQIDPSQGGDINQLRQGISAPILDTRDAPFLMALAGSEGFLRFLVVKDALGQVISSRPIAPEDTQAEWDGTSGTVGASYFASVQSHDSSGNVLSETLAAYYAELTEMRLENGTVSAILKDGTSIALPNILALRKSEQG